MLTEKLMQLTVAGGSEWVMILLLVLSVISVSVIVERVLFFRTRKGRIGKLDEALSPLILKNDYKGICKALDGQDEPILRAAAESCGPDVGRDREAAEHLVAGASSRERLRLEQRLTFLGTLGNNAPFIGLLGTVLGIIRAFRDLSMDSQGNSSVVMAGISEALVATAVGLFVALPAVMAFNYFMKQVDGILSINEALAQGILAGKPAPANGGGPAKKEA